MGRSIWRSRGCSLAGLDEEGLVWGRSEEFDERGLKRVVCRFEFFLADEMEKLKESWKDVWSRRIYLAEIFCL